MANRPRGYGFSSEVASKINNKYSADLEQQAREWLESVVGGPLVEDVDNGEPLGEERFRQALKDGVILCNVINILKPGSVKKVHIVAEGRFKAVKEMENIGNFLQAIETYGVKRTDLFQTSNLTDKNNGMSLVLNCIYGLGRAARNNGYTGATLGPKESISNPRTFDEETIQAGKTLIGLQYGYTGGANQKGINFGKTRSITD